MPPFQPKPQPPPDSTHILHRTHCSKGHPLTGDNLYWRRRRNSNTFLAGCRQCKRVTNVRITQKRRKTEFFHPEIEIVSQRLWRDGDHHEDRFWFSLVERLSLLEKGQVISLTYQTISNPHIYIWRAIKELKSPIKVSTQIRSDWVNSRTGQHYPSIILIRRVK